MCGHDGLEVVLSLGEQPLANALLSADQLARPEPRYPLELAFCSACALAQITFSVPPEQLFADYPYFSSYADAVTNNAKNIATRVMAERGIDGSSLAVEVASNDGYLLEHYVPAAIPVLGSDPARNVVAEVEARCVPPL